MCKKEKDLSDLIQLLRFPQIENKFCVFHRLKIRLAHLKKVEGVGYGLWKDLGFGNRLQRMHGWPFKVEFSFEFLSLENSSYPCSNHFVPKVPASIFPEPCLRNSNVWSALRYVLLKRLHAAEIENKCKIALQNSKQNARFHWLDWNANLIEKLCCIHFTSKHVFVSFLPTIIFSWCIFSWKVRWSSGVIRPPT